MTDASTRAPVSGTARLAPDSPGTCAGCDRPLTGRARTETPLEALWRRLRRLGLAPGAPALMRRKRTSTREQAGSS